MIKVLRFLRKKIAKKVVCANCSAELEYLPEDVRTLWSGTDIGGGPDGAKGFTCPNCGKDVILERW